MLENLTISIVTVVYNSVDQIETTILSVLNQSYPKIQYIIIDGGSTDGTLDILEKYRNQIDLIISEPDKGIYDAMNKSVNYCKGEWLNFMNSGDIFDSTEIIEQIFNSNTTDEFNIIYGKHKVAYGNKIISKKSNPVNELWKGMTIQHQSIFIRKSILEEYPFNTNYKFAADFDILYYCYKKGYQFKFINKFVSIVASNGVSELNSVKTYSEFKKIALFHENSNINLSKYYNNLILKRKFIRFMKEKLPFLNKIRLYLK